jgi:hypothetical protein
MEALAQVRTVMNGVIRRLLQYGLSTLIVAVLVLVGLNFYSHQNQNDAAAAVNRAPARAPVSHAINGFRYSANHAGRIGLEIRADRFELKKKKVGMLRFGMIKEARFSNARIDLYSDQPASVDSTNGHKQPVPGDVSLQSLSETISFKDAFNAESLATLSTKNVAAVRFAPIELRLHAGGQVEVTVTADRASIKPQSREMQFTGNVRWKRGPVTLRADDLLASLEKNSLRVPRDYHIDNHGEVTGGRNLLSDLLLSRIVDDPPTFAVKPKSTQLTNASAKEVHSHAERR